MYSFQPVTGVQLTTHKALYSHHMASQTTWRLTEILLLQFGMHPKLSQDILKYSKMTMQKVTTTHQQNNHRSINKQKTLQIY